MLGMKSSASGTRPSQDPCDDQQGDDPGVVGCDMECGDTQLIAGHAADRVPRRQRECREGAVGTNSQRSISEGSDEWCDAKSNAPCRATGRRDGSGTETTAPGDAGSKGRRLLGHGVFLHAVFGHGVLLHVVHRECSRRAREADRQSGGGDTESETVRTVMGLPSCCR